MSIIGKQTKSRGLWQIKPATRVKKSKKVYDRKQHKQEMKKGVDTYA